MRPTLQNQPQIGALSQALLDAMRVLVAAIQAGWNQQHAGDGSHTGVTATSATVSGLTTLGKLRLTQAEYVEPGATGGTVHNISTPTLASVSCLRIVASSNPLIITGIDATGREPGDLLLVLNCDDTLSPHDVWLNTEDAGSAAANRFAETSAGTGPLVIQGSRGVWLCYDYQRTSATSGTRLPRWRIIDQA
jgi:hypothetical protein